VDIRDKIRKALTEVYGNFETYLESEYEKYISDNLTNASMSNKRKWITYNQVILELKHNIKNMLKVKELQYKLTEDAEPREVCIEVIETLEIKTPELERLYYKIRNF
jgi:arginine utilization protein RocB|tara:strand:+ start:1038 stop:1358 length:321 start_codon:yes stop_codon:yes gene_type:complete